MNFNRKMKGKFVKLAKSVKQQFQVQERFHWLQNNNYYYLKQICKYWDSPILGKNPVIVCPKTINCKKFVFFQQQCLFRVLGLSVSGTSLLKLQNRLSFIHLPGNSDFKLLTSNDFFI